LVDASRNGACYKVNTTKASYKKADFASRWDSCPKGYKKDPNKSCYKCTSGYWRTGEAVGHKKACTKDLIFGPFKKASFSGKWGSCKKGYRKDPNGKCWSCASGYSRTAASVNGSKACVKAAKSDKLLKVTNKHNRAGTGACPSGKFKHILPGSWFGYCASCPSGYNRNANNVTGTKACDKFVTTKSTKALK
jgi:hypothetical protein